MKDSKKTELWPTPSAHKTTQTGKLTNADGTDWDGIQKPHQNGKPVQTALADAVKARTPRENIMWPTPRANSAMAATITPESVHDPKRFPNLETVVGQREWPPPNNELPFCYRAAFLAKTCPPQESKRESMVNEVVYGVSSPELLASYDTSRQSFLLRTFQRSLLANPEHGCDEWRETFPKSWCMEIDPTESKVMLYQLETLMDVYPPERPTDESGHGLWPTPDCQNHRDGTQLRQMTIDAAERGSRRGVSLHHAVANPQMWPTPTTMDNLPPKSPEALMREATVARPGRSRPANLRDCVQPESMEMWSTPQANEDAAGTPAGKMQKGALSPNWVSWLMGLPLDWLDIDGYRNPELDGLPPEYLTEQQN